MNVIYITEADGMLLFRTASTNEERGESLYQAELKLHRYEKISLRKFEYKETLKTTNSLEATDNHLKIDKFKK